MVLPQASGEGTLIISTMPKWNFVNQLDSNRRNGIRLQDLVPWSMRLFGITFLGLLLLGFPDAAFALLGPIAFGLVIDSFQRRLLQISAEGICFSYANPLLPESRSKAWRQQVSWSQIVSIAHRHEPASFLCRHHRNIVYLRFRNGQQFDINLDELSPAQREQFFFLLPQVSR